MTQSKMLNYLLGTTSKVEILRTLFESDDAMTGRRIASTAKISPRSCQLSLDALVKVNALQRKAVGRAFSYSLNRDHKVVWDLLRPLFEAERQIHKDATAIISKFTRAASNDLVSVFWSLPGQKKSEGLNYVLVTKAKKSGVTDEMLAKINGAISAQYGFSAKGEVVAAADFNGSHFSSEAAKKRFSTDFIKLKGASFDELAGGATAAKRGRKPVKKA
jgi:hypothetical protein